MSSTVDPPIPATVNGNAPTKKRDILERYQRWMTRNPLKARCFTYAVIGAVGSMIGSRKARGPRKPKVIDWLEVVSFAMHGGLVGGPLSHYMNRFFEENFHDSESHFVLIDQLIFQPPQLFLMFVTIHMSRSAVSSIPNAVTNSLSILGPSVADSWKIWPLAMYILLRVVKKKKHYLAAVNLCSVAWVARLAKLRSNRVKP